MLYLRNRRQLAILELAVPSTGERHIDDELRELRKVLHFREGAYRGAWFLSALAMIFMFIGSVLFVLVQLGRS